MSDPPHHLPEGLAGSEEGADVAPHLQVRSESVGGIVDRVQVLGSAGERTIPLGLGAVVGSVVPPDMGVVVVLMNGHDRPAGVDHWATRATAPDEPVVETGSTDRKCRQRIEQARV